MLKLIHPKTGTVREVAENYHNKIRILRRGGFVDFDTYKAPKKKEVVPDPTVAEIVAKNKEEDVEQSDEPTTEIAIHVSSAARVLIEEHGLDPDLIEGTGKNGQINKPDVEAYLESLEPVKQEPVVEEESVAAEDILTHDDSVEEEETE